jgi:hypothetical protein
MNITNTPAVQSSVAAAQAATADAVNIRVLKKALDLQAATAATLLQALPQLPLASSGSIGTKVNTLA